MADNIGDIPPSGGGGFFKRMCLARDRPAAFAVAVNSELAGCVKSPDSPMDTSECSQNGAPASRSPNDLPNGENNNYTGKKLVEEVVALLLKTWENRANKNGKIVDFLLPEDMKKSFDLAVADTGNSEDKMVEICKQIVDLSLHAGHPAFFNQLWGGLDEYGLMSAWMVEALHTSVYTYEVAPSFTLMELYMIRYVGKELIGYTDEDDIDGLFNPGGSISNILGMHLARYRYQPDVKKKGNATFDKPLIILTSEECHYSLQKGASVMGLGTDNVWKVAVDEFGCMIPEELERRIKEAHEQGVVPFFVSATSGTTVFGAFDPLDAIADICQKYNIWMHVDAAWGGAAMVSPKLSYLVKGINRADSVIWNPHKMLGLPLQTAMFITKHKKLLHECNSNKSSYLFQSDKFYDMDYDIGDKTFMCGRKNDALKLWLSWKGRGRSHLAAAVENAFDMAEYLASLIREKEGFHLVIPKVQCTNVCFYYIPPSVRSNVDWNSDKFRESIGKVAPRLKQRMMEQGTLFIGYQPHENRKLPNFFRMVIHCNPPATKDSMKFVVDEIDRLGSDL
ncbi:cysteine sulfinic acid decarboxylase-like [Paramacrobiotus metropolitanus]|uniref:cysteine sulfinic acid decarboxylase-like n=1 Tax=Paramacrobiotus metropolitanus TaxID=2943436 RepID=UPI0024460736|nr:cysteine sulfinic acid decarboxylase-like [Paramacrobiotus metropolitanus]